MLRAVSTIAVLILVLAACGTDTSTRGDVASTDTATVRPHVDACPNTDGQPRVAHGPPSVRLPCFGAPGSVQLAGLRNTVVNVWASWCGPCREEMPRLQAAHRRWGASIGLLGVDSKDSPSAAAAFLKDAGVTYAQALDKSGSLPGALGSPGLPVTIAIDSTGAVVFKHAGELSAADVATIQAKLGR